MDVVTILVICTQRQIHVYAHALIGSNYYYDIVGKEKVITFNPSIKKQG
jgi:hypothetical protein